jgi:hypothetical protein
MDKAKFFKVKVGYGNDDFIIIDDTELAKCLRAQLNGSMVICKEGSISGKSIITITPDINKLMGWNRTYQPSAEDYGKISDKSLNAHRELLENTMLQITGKQPDETKNLPPNQFTKELADKFKI